MVIWDLEHSGSFVWRKKEAFPCNDKKTCMNGKIVYLINESSQSVLETMAWVARVNYHATLIGRPTLGVLGQVIKFGCRTIARHHRSFSEDLPCVNDKN